MQGVGLVGGGEDHSPCNVCVHSGCEQGIRVRHGRLLVVQSGPLAPVGFGGWLARSPPLKGWGCVRSVAKWGSLVNASQVWVGKLLVSRAFCAAVMGSTAPRGWMVGAGFILRGALVVRRKSGVSVAAK